MQVLPTARKIRYYRTIKKFLPHEEIYLVLDHPGLHFNRM